jgi:hypothetical protein
VNVPLSKETSQRSKDLILLILDMQGIENAMREFERKYRLRSDLFYQLVQEGRLEQSMDFLEWLGMYETLQEREAEYRQIIEQEMEEILPYLNDELAAA